MTTFNNGYDTCNSFYSAVQDSHTSKLRFTFASNKDKENHKETENMVDFIEVLWVVN